MVEENRQSPQGPPPAEATRADARDGLLNPAVRYERSDASFRWILGILIGALVVAFVIFFAVLRLFDHFRAREAIVKRSQFPATPSASESLPPEPRLEQINRMAGVEKGNVALRHEQKEAILHSYGPAEEGYVHIPIDRAIDRLAERLASRAKRPTPEQSRRQNGLVGGGEPNSGRMFRGTTHD